MLQLPPLRYQTNNAALYAGTAAPPATLDLDFTTGTLDPRITFTRASIATFFDSAGVLQTATSGTARFDYDPVALAARGLLLEESRINIVKWNRDLTNAAWVRTNCTAAKDQTGLDGVASSASRITASAANGTCLQTITTAAVSRYQSAYVKRLVGSGTVEMTMDNGATWTVVAVTPSWTRVSCPLQSFVNPTVGFRIATSGDSIAVDYVQNEANNTNSIYISSPIATTTANVTRAADTAVMTGTNFSSWFAHSAHTFVWEGDTSRHASLGNSCFATVTAASASRESFGPINSGTSATFTLTTGGSMTVSGITIGTPYKAACAYVLNDAAACLNGGAVVQDTSVSLTADADKLWIGSSLGASSFLNGHVKRLRFWNTRLSNSELQVLTT